MRFLMWAGLCCILLVGGCTSTQERFDKATRLEQEGRYEDAAEYYIQVLKREPDWTEARDALVENGIRAVDGYLDAANEAEDRRDYDRALELLEHLDDFRSDAAEVGVDLEVPGDYEEYRSELVQGAIDWQFRLGEEAEARGDWSAALEAYERAETRYDLTAEQQRDVALRMLEVNLSWAEQDLAEGRFRGAFERAGRLLEQAGTSGASRDRIRRLQEAAVEQGTRPVAFLPVLVPRAVEQDVPRGFVEALNEVLSLEYWAAPPPFIVAADPVRLRRELRDRRWNDLSRAQAAEIGRSVRAAFVVVNELEAFDRRELNVREEKKKARLRGRPARDTTFTIRSYTLEIRTELDYQVVDPVTGQLLAEGTIPVSESGSFRQGSYAGTLRNLELSSADRRLFDVDALREEEGKLEDRIVDEMAERLSERVFDELIGRIE